ncbi:MAG TPA: flagellar hook-basal body complex protein FliE [Polyangiaceae bacterium]|nr:flagellar hook-basal body complex protein FliE [Polyangiaceae bacterium]
MPIEGPTFPLFAPHAAFEATPTKAEQAEATDAAASGVFEDLLKSMAVSANQSIQQAAAQGEAFAAGTRDDIHGTMVSLSKADIELRVLGNVRNRVIDAFYEIWRMQI